MAADVVQDYRMNEIKGPVVWLRRALLLVGVGSLMAGCSVWTGTAWDRNLLPSHMAIESSQSTDPTVGARIAATHPAVKEFQSVTIESPKPEPPQADYRVGPNDALFVNVYGSPELGSPLVSAAGASGSGGSRVLGSSVDGSGNIQLPLINVIAVGGLTVREIQAKISNAFKPYIEKPWVVVEVVEHRSQPIYLVGQFNQPGSYFMDRPTNVVQALAMGRGLAKDADIRGARVQRGNRVLPVDVYRLLREGDFSQNIWLKPNDALYVPDNIEQQVFVVGAVDRAGPVPMLLGRLDLVQALAQAGGQIKIGSDLKYVRLIRSLSPTRGELMVIDVEKILRGQALSFPLMAGDIVYVPRSTIGNWHDVFSEILPVLQAFSAALQPFALVASGNN
jgi:polysaccharide export outer membrane protein